jgi:hypothetical protein
MSGPMDENAEVGLTITEGPICGLGDDEIAASYPLWDSIVAAESFPPGAGASGADYIVSLKKGVNHVNEVRPAEDELTKAFQMLAAAWPFSGGSYLIIETREVVCSPRLASNADDIEQEMLSRSGLTRVVSSFARQISGEYQCYQKASGQIIPCIYCIPCTRRARTTRTEPRYKPQVAPAWAQKMS